MKRLITLLLGAALTFPAFASVTDTSLGRVVTVGNGATTAFGFTFPVVNRSDLSARSVLSGVDQGLTFSVSLNSDQINSPGGTVTFTAAPANTAIVTIQRIELLNQLTVLPVFTPFPAKTVERTFDSVTRKVQQVERDVQDLSAKETVDISNVIAGGVAGANLLAPIATGETTGLTLAERFSYIKNPKGWGSRGDCSTDDVPGIAAAIAAIGTKGGVVDARSLACPTFGSTLTISKGGIVLLLPFGDIALGTHQIVIPVGVGNVTIAGSTAFGDSTSNQGLPAKGTRFTYTGSGAAIQAGDSTNDTFGVRLQDFTLDMSGAANTAIGIQMNRIIGQNLKTLNIGMSNAATAQKAIDLEGGVNYTGGKIEDVNISGGAAGSSGIYFGQNANGNFIFGGHLAMNGGTGYNFVGTAGGFVSGNAVYGGDIENCGTALVFDRAINILVSGTRVEGCTGVVNATANSAQNHVFSSGTNAMTVTDLGANNSFTDAYWTQFGRNLWKLKNTTDTLSNVILQAGLATEQEIDLDFIGIGGRWRLQKNTSATPGFSIINTANIPVLSFTATNTQLTPGNTTNGAVQVFGYLQSAAPLTAATLGTPVNGAIIYCTDCTIANPCAGGGTGAFAKRLNGVWVCN